MAGEVEEWGGAAERRNRLEDALRRTADPSERELLKGRLDDARRELRDASARVKAAAQRGDVDAKRFLEAIHTLADRE